MFFVNKSKVVDTRGRLVGVIKEGKFSQSECDVMYRTGLLPIELEQISEAMQRQRSHS